MILNIDTSTKYLDTKDFQFLEWKHFDYKGNVVLAYRHNNKIKEAKLPVCILKETSDLNSKSRNEVTTEIVRVYLSVIESDSNWKMSKNIFSKIDSGGIPLW